MLILERSEQHIIRMDKNIKRERNERSQQTDANALVRLVHYFQV